MKNRIKTLQYGILTVCALIFIVCGVLFLKSIADYREANSFYDDITIDGSETDLEPNGENEIPPRVLSLMASYRALKAEHPNIVGYINIPAVSIGYPVVQWTNNEYYTTHLITGEENKSGSIFLDYHVNTSPALAPNLILYGHNMNDGSMFHPMRNLFDEDTFYEARVEYICDEGVFFYDSLSVYVTDTSDPYYAYDFYDEDVFANFFEGRASLSRFPVEYESVSHIITLVTCSNSATKPDQRLLYHGRLTEAYTQLGEES